MIPAIELYPYQKAWIQDRSRFLEGRWARQTGKSFASAVKIVLDSREKPGNKWICISSGERQVKEFMQKIKLHAEITEKTIKLLESNYGFTNDAGEKEEYKILEARLRNGSEIIGIPANADTARGYSANVYLDEFSTHKCSREIWAAVFPIVSRSGFQMMITYTPKGKQNKAYDVSKNELFAHHIVDIETAVNQGCPLNIETLRRAIDDPELWEQEYEIKFIDETTAWLTYDMINSCESDTAGFPEKSGSGEFYIGNDIGRRNHLWAGWVLEKVGDVFWTREVSTLRGVSFSAQEFELERLMMKYNPVRCCMDQTGMGEKPVEDAKKKFGSMKVEGILFQSGIKLNLATLVRRIFEDRLIRVPIDSDLRNDLHSVKKITTVSGNIRFDAENSKDGHADRFWALALALHAADAKRGKIYIG